MYYIIIHTSIHIEQHKYNYYLRIIQPAIIINSILCKHTHVSNLCVGMHAFNIYYLKIYEYIDNTVVGIHYGDDSFWENHCIYIWTLVFLSKHTYITYYRYRPFMLNNQS